MKRRELTKKIMRNVAWQEVKAMLIKIFVLSFVSSCALATLVLAANQTLSDMLDGGLGMLTTELKADSEIIGFFLTDIQTIFAETYNPLLLLFGLLSLTAITVVLLTQKPSKLIRRFKNAYPYIQKT